MKSIVKQDKSSLLHIISNLNPFKIMSDIENERTEVKKLEIVYAICVMIIYQLLIATPVSNATTTHNTIISLLLLIVTFFIVTIMCKIIIVNIENNYIKSVKKFTIKNILFLIIILLGCLLVACSLLFPIEKMLPGFEDIVTFQNSLAKTTIFMIIYSSILGPVMEEFVFRGIILGGLLKSHSNKTALLVSTLIFGIMHIDFAKFVVASIMGLLLGYLYMKTRSIYLCMLLHGLYNTLSGVVLYYPYNNISIDILSTVVGLVFIIFGFKKLIGNINNSNIQKTLNIG